MTDANATAPTPPLPLGLDPPSDAPSIAADESSLLPPVLRWSGPLLEPLYRAGLAVHRKFSTPRRAPLPVICIGNLTVGGTGKTPATIYVARARSDSGRRPAVLLRGYKDQGNDEAREIERALADRKIPVLLGADRHASAQKALDAGRDCVVLDDGFQHWRLARDLDIVLVDALRPFGNGHCLPRGRLREPPTGLARAGIVILTRAERASSGVLKASADIVQMLAPKAIVATASHSPLDLRPLNSEQAHHGQSAPELPLDTLRGTPVLGACGLARPDTFRQTLLAQHADVRRFIPFSDHHRFTAADVEHLRDQAQQCGATAVVVTEKDAVKLEPLVFDAPFPFWSLRIKFKLQDNIDKVWGALDKAFMSAEQ